MTCQESFLLLCALQRFSHVDLFDLGAHYEVYCRGERQNEPERIDIAYENDADLVHASG